MLRDTKMEETILFLKELSLVHRSLTYSLYTTWNYMQISNAFVYFGKESPQVLDLFFFFFKQIF